MTKSENILTYTAQGIPETYAYTNMYRQHYWFMYNIPRDNLILNLTREALRIIY